MKKSYGCLVLTIGIAMTSPGSFAAEKKASAEEQCIPINQIRRTQVVDDQHILFYMNNGKEYINYLPLRCAGLGSTKAFKYTTSHSQLCSVDIITVIDSSMGDALRGASCGLGMFVPTDPNKSTQKD